MDNQNNDLGALTEQPVTISLGSKSYKADRITLYHIGLYNRYRDERVVKGDLGNLEIDCMLSLLTELIKPYEPEITIDKLAKSIPFSKTGDISEALKAVGFTQPQKEKSPTKEPAGVNFTQ